MNFKIILIILISLYITNTHAKNERITALENQNKKLVEDIESIKKHLNI